MNSSKPWRKGVLVACVAMVLLCGGVPAIADEDPDFVTHWQNTPMTILKPFTTTTESWDHLSVSFWTSADDVEYTVAIYSTQPTPVDPSGHIIKHTDDRGPKGYEPVTFSSLPGYSAGTYYATLTLGNNEYAVMPNGLGASWYAHEHGDGSGDWYDLDTHGHLYLDYVGGGELPNPSNLKFILDVVASVGGALEPDIWVEQTHPAGNWEIDPERGTFEAPNTLKVTMTAKDLGPFDAEIGVQGGMSPISLDGTFLNESGEDWPGIVLQLGSGLGGDFELATDMDGLAFTDGEGGFWTQLVIPQDTPYETSLEGLWSIVLPEGRDEPFFFTLRTMAIPEPGTLLLLAFAALGLLAFRRR